MVAYSANMNVMLKAARRAARGLIRDFGEVENLQVSRKGARDFVTASDLKAEEILFEELSRARPDYAFLMEERGEVAGKDGCSYRWIVDPLDGTVNFMHGIAYFAISIALEKKFPSGGGEIIASLTYAPVLKEIFWAEKGKGAWYESADSSASVRLRVSGRKNMDECLLSIGSFATDIDISRKFISKVSAIRCFGSTTLAMALTSAGRLDAFIQSNPKYWDYAAGILLVSEAGGNVSSFDDKNSKNQLVVSNNLIFSSVCRELGI